MKKRQPTVDDPKNKKIPVPRAAPRSPRLTWEQEYILCEQAMALRLQGKTYRQIGALVGISKSAAYSRVQTLMVGDRKDRPHFEADVRDECMTLLRKTVGPVIANAEAGDLASFRALNTFSNTMMKLAKIRNPSREKIRRRAARLLKYMNDQDPDLSAKGVFKYADVVGQTGGQSGGQAGGQGGGQATCSRATRCGGGQEYCRMPGQKRRFVGQRGIAVDPVGGGASRPRLPGVAWVYEPARRTESGLCSRVDWA